MGSISCFCKSFYRLCVYFYFFPQVKKKKSRQVGRILLGRSGEDKQTIFFLGLRAIQQKPQQVGNNY